MADLKAPAKVRRLAPPMSWRTRLSIFAAGYLTDATCRADGTINRRLLTYLDPAVPPSAAPRNGVSSRDIDVDPAIPLRARLFHPVGLAGPLPVVLFFHGGGFAYLSAASLAYDAACRRIARYCGAAVLSVDYRRSPEHRFPAAYDDGFSALRFLDDPKKHPADVGPLDVSRCFLRRRHGLPQEGKEPQGGKKIDGRRGGRCGGLMKGRARARLDWDVGAAPISGEKRGGGGGEQREDPNSPGLWI